jgi:hypothetical protein
VADLRQPAVFLISGTREPPPEASALDAGTRESLQGAGSDETAETHAALNGMGKAPHESAPAGKVGSRQCNMCKRQVAPVMQC